MALLAFYLEPLWPLGDIRWLLGALFGIIVMVIWEIHDQNPQGFRERINEASIRIFPWIQRHWMSIQIAEFDMPIRNAIKHLVNEVPHSFQGSRRAENAAFKHLHEKMCSGDILVVGSTSEFEAPDFIPPHKLRRLVPVEVVVPQNRSTPEGVRYSLTEKSLPKVDSSYENPFSEYRNLRVRSWEVYGIWPKTEEAEE